MPRLALNSGDGVIAIAQRFTTGPFPTGPDGGGLAVAIDSGDFRTVRLLTSRIGTVTALTFNVYVYNHVDNIWYTPDAGALTVNPSANRYVDVVIGKEERFNVAIGSITPGTVGNEVTIRAVGIPD